MCALPGKAVLKMTYNVSGRTLNPTRSVMHLIHFIANILQKKYVCS